MTSAIRLRDASRHCPKRMVFGPCGGVRRSGDCELSGIRCPFVDESAALHALTFSDGDIAAPESARAHGDVLGVSPRLAAADEFAARVSARSVITADLPVRTSDPAVLAEAGARLASLTAVVAAEPPSARAALTPTHTAAVLGAAGARVIVSLTCRDRNRVALEGELAALADLGVAGVLAVTGDMSTAARPVFDLDSTRLAALARRAGLFVAVAEQPAAPPLSYRPARLELKARAGAELGILSLCDGTSELAAFAAAVGAAIPLVVSVPVITSTAAAARLAARPGVELPRDLVATVADAHDPVEAGVRAAAAWATIALGIPGVVGVHLATEHDDTGADDTEHDDTGVDGAAALAAAGLAAVDAIARTAALIRETAAPVSGWAA